MMCCCCDCELKAVLQNPVTQQDVVLKSMVSYLKIQSPSPLKATVLKQSIEQSVLISRVSLFMHVQLTNALQRYCFSADMAC